MKQMVDKLQQRGEEITARRASVSFAPRDTSKVEEWEAEQKSKPNSLKTYFKSWTRMQQSATRLKEENVKQEDENGGSSGDSDSEDRHQGSKKRKINTKVQD